LQWDDRSRRRKAARWAAGFTLVEALVALSILAIGLVPLLHLQLISIRLSERAARLSEAELLARRVMTETLAAGDPAPGTRTGTARGTAAETTFNWETVVHEARIGALDEADVTGLLRLLVRVSWQDGEDRKHVDLATIVAREGQD